MAMFFGMLTSILFGNSLDAEICSLGTINNTGLTGGHQLSCRGARKHEIMKS